MNWNDCSTSTRIETNINSARGIAEQNISARSAAHQSTIARSLAHEDAHSRKLSTLSARHANELQRLREEHLSRRRSFHATREDLINGNAYVYAAGLSVFDVYEYAQSLEDLTPQQLKALLRSLIQLWKTSAKKSGASFWKLILLIIKKQQRVKDLVKMVFIPVKILLDSLHPNKIAV